MPVTVIFAVALMLTGLSMRADRSLPQAARLPMQWTLRGRVTWRAPRRVALAFIPLMAILVMGFVAWAGAHTGTQILVGVSFVAAHLLYLWLVARTLGRTPQP